MASDNDRDRNASMPLSPSLADRRITELIDNSTAIGSLNVRFGLGALNREACTQDDAELEAAVRVEGNVFLAFFDLKSFHTLQSQMRELLVPGDVTYLQSRAINTPNLLARVRYLHAIAAITKHNDDGQAAGNAYLEAIAHYHAFPDADAAEAFNALINIVPLTHVVCRRYGLGEAFKDELIALFLDGRPTFAHAKASFLDIATEDKNIFKREDLIRLRDASIALIEEISGGSDEDIRNISKVGCRLADRLGEPHIPWLEAEAQALEFRMSLASHPLLMQTVGTRLLHLYKRLGNDEKRSVIVEKMRAARAQQEYQEVSGQPEQWGEEVERIRGEAARIVRDYGVSGALAFLAANQQMIPSVDNVNEQVKSLESKGIGIWRKLVDEVHLSGERTIGYGSSAFDEQYRFWWMFQSVGRFAAFVNELVSSSELKLSHFTNFLTSTWIGRVENVPYDATTQMPNDLVDLLSPALSLYLKLHAGDIESDMRVPALDSLVLRIEAVLRKLARLLGESDTYTDKDNVTQVLGLRALLDNRAIAECCGVDLITFARYTLMREPEGLRDQIGHAIMHFDQYDQLHVDAVVLLILRLSALDVPCLGG